MNAYLSSSLTINKKLVQHPQKVVLQCLLDEPEKAAPAIAVLPAPVMVRPVRAQVMSPPLLPHGIQEPVESGIQPAEETIEEDNDVESNEAELADYDLFNNQLTRQNEQRADNLEDLSSENLF